MELLAFGVVLLLVAGGWLIYRSRAATDDPRRNASSLAQDVARPPRAEQHGAAPARSMRSAVSTPIPRRMAAGSIEERVVATIAKQLGVKEDAVALDAPIARDLFGASPCAVEAIMALEDEFGLRITDEDAATITTARRAVEHITRALASK
jgi:acyl carrier protein